MNGSFEEERTAPRPPRRSVPRDEPAAPAALSVVTSVSRTALVVVDGDSTAPPPQMHLPEPEPTPPPVAPLNYPSMLALAGMKTPPRVRAIGRRRGRGWTLLRVIEVGLVLAALVFGGIEFKHRVLDLRWDVAVADEAATVARQRGLDWRRAVPVAVLPADAYRLALVEQGLVDAGVPLDPPGSFAQTVAGWRALGLLEGAFDLAATGELAAASMPVFYDGAAGRIVMLDGIGDDARAVSLHRALTLALLDQRFGWTDQLETGGTEERAALRGRVDGDALDIASVSVSTPLDEQRSRSDAVSGGVPTGQQYPFELVTNRVALTVAAGFADLRSLDERDAQHDGRAGSDAAVLAGTLIDTADSVDMVGASGSSLGRLGWWYALAGRLPAAEALAVARSIAGDAVEPIDAQCVRAQVWTATPEAATQLTAAFATWAALAPTSSGTTVRPLDIGSGVEVTSCDPGPDADTVTVDALAAPG